MLYDDGDRLNVRNVVLTITTLAWMVVIWTRSPWTPGSLDARAHHHAVNLNAVSPGALADWLLMLAATMAPLLIQPIQFVRGNSLARRRARSTWLFVASYTTVWMVAGIVLLAFASLLKSSALPQDVQSAAVFFIALVWQCSPAKQVCLNRCHTLRELAAFGRAAHTDVIAFGATQGVWCTGSCWAWMLLPLLTRSGHIAIMVGTAALIFCERLDGPAPLRWRWRGLGRAYRIIARW